MATVTFGKKKKQGDKDTDPTWNELLLQGSSVALALVKDAAEYAPVPGLKQAAGIALQIISTAQAVKDNKAAFEVLGSEATALIAAIWRSYQTSVAKEGWPSSTLAPVIQELVKTLSSINEYVENKVERNTFKRIVFSTSDKTKIVEYQNKLRAAVTEFELSSHLTIVEFLRHILSSQAQILKQLADKGISVEPTVTETIIEPLKAMRIEDPRTPRTAPTCIQNPLNADADAEAEAANIAAAAARAAARRVANEANNLADKVNGKRKQNDDHSKYYRQATVETDDETDDAETGNEDEGQTSSASSVDSESVWASSAGQQKNSKRHKKEHNSKSARINVSAKGVNTSMNMYFTSSIGDYTPPGSTGNATATASASMGNINASMGNTSPAPHTQPQQYYSHSPPMFQPSLQNPQPAGAQYNPYFPDYNQYASHASPLPHYGLPPTNPFPVHGTPAQIFGNGTYVNNYNSGQVTTQNFIGGGNDNRIINYAPQPRKKRGRD